LFGVLIIYLYMNNTNAQNSIFDLKIKKVNLLGEIQWPKKL